MIAAKGAKYAAVVRITLKQQTAYRMDFLMRSLFLLLILYVFMQLWSAAYSGQGEGAEIAGFRLKDIIWYLVLTEAFTMAFPQLCTRIEEEVKSGGIAVRLLTPISYAGYQYASYLGEAALRFVVNLACGSLIGWMLVGPPELGAGWSSIAVLGLGSFTLAFLLNLSIALCSFWVEETRGLEFILQKLQFTVGGMLIPLDLMPHWLQQVCAWLPFQAVLYFPAKSAVSGGEELGAYVAQQLGWIAVMAALCAWIYSRGIRRLNANGG
ncbi:ABC-2 family transporter protein [Paenibacillus sp. FSL W8-1187]|uniref:Glucose-6-phosphate isomerase n=1 Tax=Paenibacillus pasadenensis TaxID=217090 RepID=A0A2N5N7X0_9BACL|nr:MULTISPECIES: ABC-2 family transporter protein [Paenibacillus]PLT46428.1 Glucose-6-phosphate isomerase [Paenibacillus pasadenensis]